MVVLVEELVKLACCWGRRLGGGWALARGGMFVSVEGPLRLMCWLRRRGGEFAVRTTRPWLSRLGGAAVKDW